MGNYKQIKIIMSLKTMAGAILAAVTVATSLTSASRKETQNF